MSHRLYHVVLISGLILLTPFSAYGYSPSNFQTSEGHSWIIKKAVDHLNRNSKITKYWPLDSYLPWLVLGSWYADHTGAMNCTWTFGGTHDCDAIHHYGKIGDIHSKFAVTVGNTGDFAAPEYTEYLFNQAILFYPGGEKPALDRLPYKYGGRAEHLLDTSELGNTYAGGLPFCERWVFQTLFHRYTAEISAIGIPTLQLVAAQRARNELSANPEYCPKWPYFISDDNDSSPLLSRYQTAQEGIRNAMLYLGWAVHVMQDITVPQNAANFGDQGSEAFEKRASWLMKEGKLEHLPLFPGGPRNYVLGTDPNFPSEISAVLNKNQSIQQLVTALVNLTLDSFNFYDVSDGGYMMKDSDGRKEKIIDAAILFTAEVLERYFANLMLTQDQLEPNDHWADASVIDSSIRFPQLNIHSPIDKDGFEIAVPNTRSQVVIEIKYDSTRCGLAAILEGQGSRYPPRTTPSGLRIELEPRRRSSYRLTVSPTSIALCQYGLEVDFSDKSLSEDWMESNDSEQTAKKIVAGDYDQLNIHDASDQDWFELTADDRDEFTASIKFDPRGGRPQLFANGIESTDLTMLSTTSAMLTIRAPGTPSMVLLQVKAQQSVEYSLHTTVSHCVVDSFYDCAGNCIYSQAAKQRAGDGSCDNGQYGIDLMCSQFNDDGGDCINGNAEINSTCGPSSVYDCSRRCQLTSMVSERKGDKFCDDGGRQIYLSCTEFKNDGGDCDAVVDNTSCEQATPIPAGSSIKNSISLANEVDWYKIDVSGFHALIIESVGETDTRGTIYSSCDAPELRSDDNGGEGNNFRLVIFASGTYYISVQHANPDGVGSYRVRTRLRPSL